MSVCKRCNGTNWWHYDHNHSQICPDCCTHSQGWWELTEGYAGYKAGADNACCNLGCGTMRRELSVANKEPKAKDD